MFLSFYGWFRGSTALGGIWKTFEGRRGCNEGQRATFRWGDGYDVASKWNFSRADANHFCVSGNQGWHHKVRMIRVDHAAQARPAHSARMRWLSWSMARWGPSSLPICGDPCFFTAWKVYIFKSPLPSRSMNHLTWNLVPRVWALKETKDGRLWSNDQVEMWGTAWKYEPFHWTFPNKTYPTIFFEKKWDGSTPKAHLPAKWRWTNLAKTWEEPSTSTPVPSATTLAVQKWWSFWNFSEISPQFLVSNSDY